MCQSTYIEDVFVEFYLVTAMKNIQLDYLDISPCENFYQHCKDGRAFTEKQANFIIRLLQKYKSTVCDANFDYSRQLLEKKFKKTFRVISDIKRLYIEVEKDDSISICLQFPYAFKEKFMEEFSKKGQLMPFVWDENSYARKIDFFEANIFQIHLFAIENNFVIDETFQKIVSDMEQAISQQELITPISINEGTAIKLHTDKNNVLEYFQSNKNNEFYQNAFLAKTMGYPLKIENISTDPLEKIISSDQNTFWMNDLSKFFHVYQELQQKVAIILDRTDNVFEWLVKFYKESQIFGIDSSKIKICFRDDKHQETGINEWIKENNLGGKLDGADILIFRHVPAKWLFKQENYAKILVTTMIHPPTSSITEDYLNSHPCTIYLSPIKPTIKGNKKIVEL